mmetsp:Transcript_13710/g.34915  ORF Transcript_13710/g.34915 Transcript_13710/m.34915 type:complete len:1093 (-) Transcript_13710:73-3351(-)
MRVLLISDPEIGRESSEPKPSGARKGAGRGREEEDDDEEMDGGEEDECESGDDDDESEGEEDDEGDEEEGGKPARRPRDSRGGASVGEGGDEEDATKKAACALCLGVGYLCDPKQVDGLAHFTEHMLFMGTKDFPGENEWSGFLSKAGGEDNGETDAETTTFYFDVRPDALKEALGRFAAFFASPLFRSSGSAREVKAIESEFQQARQSDSTRRVQLLAELSDEGHPYRRFGWGNRKSLVELPEANKVDVPKALAKFHKSNYASELMTAVVLGKEPLDTLQEWVVGSAGNVPKRGIERPNFEEAGMPIGPERLPLLAHVEPLKMRRRVDLIWFLPPQHGEAARAKAADYISHLLGHEGAGSCLSVLKEAGLATELSAGAEGEDHTSAAMQFTVSVTLTEAGLADVDSAICAVLAYCGLLAAEEPLEWVYNELRDVGALRFKFNEGEAGIDYVRRLAISMQQHDLKAFSPDEVLQADWLYASFQPERIADLAARLTAENLVVLVSAKELLPAADAAASAAAGVDGAVAVEPWFGTRYAVQDVAEPRLARWRAARAHDEKSGGDADWAAAQLARRLALHLPKPNEFIPTDFSLKYPPPPEPPKTADASGAVAAAVKPPRTRPRLVRTGGGSLVFHAKDNKFHSPRGAFCAEIAFGRHLESGEDALYSALATSACNDMLTETTYAASVAGLQYGLSPSGRGLALEVDGFSQKLPELACRVAAAYAALADGACDDQTFERVRQSVQLALVNSGFGPLDLAELKRLRCLEARHFPAEAQLEHLPSASAAKLAAWVRAALASGVEIAAYAGGNLAASEAKALCESLREALGSPPLLAADAIALGANGCVALPAGPSHFVMQLAGKNPGDANSAIELYWQIGAWSAKVAASVSLLEHLMYEPLFDQLRTKQQLGYTVGCSTRSTHGQLGFVIRIVSATHSASACEVAALTFIEGYIQELEAMEAAAFAANVESAVSNKLAEDHSATEEASRFFAEVENRQFVFDRVEQEAAQMRAVPQATLAAWVRETICAGGAGCRRLSVFVHPGKEAAAAAGGATLQLESLPASAVPITEDGDEFKAGLQPCPFPLQPLPPLVESDD